MGGRTARQGAGLLVGDGSVLHTSLLAESGYDSNVFYTDKASRAGSGVFRVTPALQLTNTTRDGRVPAGFAYSLGASLTYREYFSSDETIKAQRALAPSAGAGITLAPQGTVSFTLADQFTRTEEAPFVRTENQVIRYYNAGYAQLRFVPGGGRLQSLIRYTNVVDWYSTTAFRRGSTMNHDGMLDLSWRWLPKTAVFLQGGVGYVDYIGAPTGGSVRDSSVPWRVVGGLRGLITPKLSANLTAGYTRANYQRGPDGSTALIGTNVTWRASTWTTLTAGYSRGIRNSPFVGSFYYVDSPGLEAQFSLGRLLLALEGRYEYRRYEGLPATGVDAAPRRRDHFARSGAVADFRVQDWFLVGAGYALVLNSSEANGVAIELEGPDYAKHQVFGRLSLTY